VIQYTGKSNEVSRAQRVLDHPPLSELLKNKSELENAIRGDETKEAHLVYGYRLAEIGRFLDLHYSPVTHIVSDDP
jgi:hypothetical protein